MNWIYEMVLSDLYCPCGQLFQGDQLAYPKVLKEV